MANAVILPIVLLQAVAQVGNLGLQLVALVYDRVAFEVGFETADIAPLFCGLADDNAFIVTAPATASFLENDSAAHECRTIAASIA